MGGLYKRGTTLTASPSQKMVRITLLAPLFFSAHSVIATRHSFKNVAARHPIIARQAAGSGQDCTNACTAWNSDPDTCNSTVVNDIATCYNCMIQAGTETREDAQDFINEFVQSCDDSDESVTNITLSGSTAALGSGSASAPAVTPAPTTSTKGKAEPTDSEDSGDATDSDDGGDPAPTDSTSANSSASASGSSPPGSTAAAGTAYALTAQSGSATALTAVLVVLSFVGIMV
ncbi:hypothetical protein C8F04DRAFT_1234738 [Mycena alexandri]|uniref:Uncharacterized protein n=1 Tax=Mycena alexandri TaxID=1745969 RepID=A0AAD6STC0_9AGAR|nr:hypothetical protein C8F04DRAFT_1234738 [Mycena alexandri]